MCEMNKFIHHHSASNILSLDSSALQNTSENVGLNIQKHIVQTYHVLRKTLRCTLSKSHDLYELDRIEFALMTYGAMSARSDRSLVECA